MAEEIKSEAIVPEVITGSALERIERATVDVQIATAHQYPRSMAVFKKRAMEMVTLDEETAQSCIYRRPVGKKNGQVEYAEGKSIRMAEIVGACYGNLRVGSILVEQTERYVKARGVAHDLESNFAASSEVVESTVTSEGRPYSERMRMVVAKATLAKARRDATFQVVPGALCKSLEEAARTTAIGTTATLGKRRTLLLDWINKAGISPELVWKALGIKGIDDVGLKELETLTGIKTAIKDGDTTIGEAFPRQAVTMPKETPGTTTTPKRSGKPATVEPGGDNGVPGASGELTTIQKIAANWTELGQDEGKLVVLLRKDKLLGQFDTLDKLAENKQAEVLAALGVYVSRASKAK